MRAQCFNNWRNVTNSNSTDRSVSPATTLLFQAPEFLPATSMPASADSDLSDLDSVRSGENSEHRSSRSRTRRAARADKGEATDTISEGRDSKPTSTRKTPAKAASEVAEVSADNPAESTAVAGEGTATETAATQRRRRTRTRARSASSSSSSSTDSASNANAAGGTSARTRAGSANLAASNDGGADPQDQVRGLKGSTRLEAKRMRRRETRWERRQRHSITEAEFLARRESVDRQMVVRHRDGLDQIAVLEDGILVEHYVARKTQQSIVGNIYLGRVHNVLPSMEAAFVDIGRGRNAVLYAGEVNWDALGMEGQPRRIEIALKAGDTVLVQVTKDTIGHKGARLTAQVTLAGRYLVLVPGSSMLGISRKLPENERLRLKKMLRENLPENSGVIVRTAAEGATEEQVKADIDRLTKQWEDIQNKQKTIRKAPALLRGEPELVVRVVRDIFNEDFSKLIVQGKETWETVSKYVGDLSPELSERLEHWTGKTNLFHEKRVDQQLAKGMDRKVWLPSGGTLIIDRTEAMTVIDVNTGKFIGSGGTLEETVTRNNLEAAEEIVRQLRLRDIGGMIIIDFVDMVLESNRELVLRRLVECLGRDRTRHQVTEVTSLGLVQMTRKRVGEGLVEAFSTTCEHCEGRGFIVHDHPVEFHELGGNSKSGNSRRNRKKAATEETSGEAPKAAFNATSKAAAEAEADAKADSKAESKSRSRRSGRNRSVTATTTEKIDEELVESALNAIMAASAKEEAGSRAGEDASAATSAEVSTGIPAENAAITLEATTSEPPKRKPRQRRRSVTTDASVPKHVEIDLPQVQAEETGDSAPSMSLEDIQMPERKTTASKGAEHKELRRKELEQQELEQKTVEAKPPRRRRRVATSEESPVS